MQHNRDNRGEVPGTDSSIDRTLCAVCQQPQRVASREPTEVLTDGGRVVAGPCRADGCGGTVVGADDGPRCDECGQRWSA